MLDHDIHPLILCGGNGKRLWPLSRAAMPKQLLALAGQETLLQATVRRAAAIPGAQPPLLVCNHEHRFHVTEQLAEIGHEPSAIFLEPVGRNTAPAIALGALELASRNPDAIMLVLPADHVIDDQDAFTEAVRLGAVAARAGHLVTFGIVPHVPETGYGYIELGAPVSLGEVSIARDPEAPTVNHVRSFVEKPDRATAEKYLEEGGYSWNSGMFLFSASAYLEELQAYHPDILSAVRLAWEGKRSDLGFCRPDDLAFAACPADSIDYAVMQSTQRAVVVAAQFGWCDVGTWNSLWNIAPKDSDGNAILGDVFASHTHNSYLRAESRLVAVIGLDDVIVVETPDAVLVMHKDRSHEISHAIEHFTQNGRREHMEHLRVYRPWGWYEGIDKGERFQVKRIMVKPNGKLSLQMHHHRAEHWVVVSGTAKVTLTGEERLIGENQSTYIPVGHLHRLENPGKIPLHLIEIQSGTYLGEDDIVRFEDTYGRSE